MMSCFPLFLPLAWLLHSFTLHGVHHMVVLSMFLGSHMSTWPVHFQRSFFLLLLQYEYILVHIRQVRLYTLLFVASKLLKSFWGSLCGIRIIWPFPVQLFSAFCSIEDMDNIQLSYSFILLLEGLPHVSTITESDFALFMSLFVSPSSVSVLQ